MEHEPGNLVAPTTSVVEAITRADVDIQVSTARRFPRDLAKAERLATAMACQDQATAESCIYAIPRDGKTISGPSIRLAEICAATYGNLRAQSRLVEEGDKSVTAMANAWDLESNYASSIEKRRSIVKSDGHTRYTQSMVDTTINAAVSVAYRDAVFKVIPKAFWQKVYNAARDMAVGSADSLGERRTRMVSYFVKLGVLQENLLASLGRKEVKDITTKDIEQLIGAANLIRDGLEDADTLFPPTLPKGGDLAGRIKAAKKPSKSEPTNPPPDPPAPPANEPTTSGEPPPAETDAHDEAASKSEIDVSVIKDEIVDLGKQLGVSKTDAIRKGCGIGIMRTCSDMEKLGVMRFQLQTALDGKDEAVP